MPGGQRAERERRVVHGDRGERGRERARERAPAGDDEPSRPGLHRLREIVVGVVAGSDDGDEEISRPQGARVDGHPAEPGVRVAPHQQPARPFDGFPSQEGLRHAPPPRSAARRARSARSASSRSLNGSLSRPTIW